MDPWSRGRKVARGVLRSSVKPVKTPIFAIGEGSIIFFACFRHSIAQMCLYQTHGRRPPPTTGCFVNTVTRGSVGAPNERALFRFLARSLFLSIDVCRVLRISPLRTNIWLTFSQADLGPTSAQGLFLVFFFEHSETFFFEDIGSWRAVQKWFGGYL